MHTNNATGVLILYTGGTIGSLRKDRDDPHSPLEPAPLEAVLQNFPDYDPAGHTITLGHSKVRLGTAAFDPPLDSSDIQPSDWIRMARIIEDNYDDYEGFVVLHGTDTLAYTSSALAFILENLSKPVVVTGSQRPIGEVRTDAEQNLITSLEIAAARSLGRAVVPEVCVFFRDDLFRGCRTTKVSARSYNAFGSPNFKPLASAGDRVAIDTRRLRPASGERLRLKKKFEPNIASLDLFPGMPPSLLRQMCDLPGLKGVVLRTYGSGNVPSSPEFLDAIADATAKGILIVNATQCLEGMVHLGRYSASASMLARGVISSLDMTREAALTKMFVVLGEESDPQIAGDRMQIDMQGEQTQSVFNLHFPGSQLEPGESRLLSPLREMVGRERFRLESMRNAVLRVTGLRLPEKDTGRIRLDASLGGCADAPIPLTETAREWTRESGEEGVFVPVTAIVRRCFGKSASLDLTLTNRGESAVAWSRLTIACFADV